jgi:hypothetical protein
MPAWPPRCTILMRTIFAPYDNRQSKARERISVTGPHLPIGNNAVTNVALLLHERVERLKSDLRSPSFGFGPIASVSNRHSKASFAYFLRDSAPGSRGSRTAVPRSARALG